MADPRVVLLNDTDVDGYHFGCARVMSVIRTQLQARNVAPVGSVAVSLNWQDAYADLVTSADVLVINGEGTLHHGSRKGRWLLEAAQAVKARGGRVALINALWQDNPDDWADPIREVDILSCRDSRSAAAMTAQTGRDVRLIGDLSMSQPVPSIDQPRSGVVFGDSVHANITTALASRARTVQGARLVPVTSSLKFVSPHLTGLRRSLRARYASFRQRQYIARNPAASFVASEPAYLNLIAQADLSVTGRFHAVCLAIATRTPFLAVSSNSWKIEALLQDIGLNPERIVSLTVIDETEFLDGAWAFSPQELTRIETRLPQWHAATNTLFDDIAALAQT